METIKLRKPTRLKDFDYSSKGAYFITICTEKRINYLSQIESEKIILTPIGQRVEEQIIALKKRYKSLKILTYVIMPNHIHLLLEIYEEGGASPSPTITDIICAFKSLVSKIVKKEYSIAKLFQRSFYDHVIRNENDYLIKLNYILENPIKWTLDELYNEE